MLFELKRLEIIVLYIFINLKIASSFKINKMSPLAVKTRKTLLALYLFIKKIFKKLLLISKTSKMSVLVLIKIKN